MDAEWVWEVFRDERRGFCDSSVVVLDGFGEEAEELEEDVRRGVIVSRVDLWRMNVR